MRFAAWLVASVAAVAGSTSATARGGADLLAELRGCLAGEAIAAETIEVACPDLVAQLQADWAEALPVDPLALSLDELEQLEAQLALYERAAAPRPDPQAIDAVLAEFRSDEVEEPPGLWQRFVAWLKSLFAREEGTDSVLGEWLANLKVSERAAKIVFYTTTGLIVALALAILVNELRRSRFGRRRAARAAVSPGAAADADDGRAPSLADVEAAPAAEQPSLLLRCVLAALDHSGRLAGSRTMTHRQLRGGTALAADHRDVFVQLVDAAEGTTYGGRDVVAGELAQLLAGGRRLLASLQVPA